ncbi:MAG: hypothetical protein MR796_07975, partial [Veillonella caviae]|nr:hypothetical protein [Veillonella caviae]MDY6225005.1 hypothetical protein [Veillonella caviae]
MKYDELITIGPNEVVETRPFPPFLPSNTTVMLMGTFPPTSEKRAMEFHYPNFQNDMWRVYGLVFFHDKDYFRKGDEKAFDSDMYPLYWTTSKGGIFMRYSYEFKRKAIELFHQGEWPETPTGVLPHT